MLIVQFFSYVIDSSEVIRRESQTFVLQNCLSIMNMVDHKTTNKISSPCCCLFLWPPPPLHVPMLPNWVCWCCCPTIATSLTTAVGELGLNSPIRVTWEPEQLHLNWKGKELWYSLYFWIKSWQTNLGLQSKQCDGRGREIGSISKALATTVPIIWMHLKSQVMSCINIAFRVNYN